MILYTSLRTKCHSGEKNIRSGERRTDKPITDREVIGDSPNSYTLRRKKTSHNIEISTRVTDRVQSANNSVNILFHLNHPR